MANPLYGFSLYKAPTNESNEAYEVVATNSTVYTLGDPITLSGGFAIVAPNATSAIIGIAAKTFTASSTAQTTGQTVPLFDVDQQYTFIGGCNADLSLNGTAVGNLYKLAVSGGTGQTFVDTNSGAQSAGVNGVVVCVGQDPQALGTTGAGGGARMGLFRFVKTNQTSTV